MAALSKIAEIPIQASLTAIIQLYTLKFTLNSKTFIKKGRGQVAPTLRLFETPSDVARKRVNGKRFLVGRWSRFCFHAGPSRGIVPVAYIKGTGPRRNL